MSKWNVENDSDSDDDDLAAIRKGANPWRPKPVTGAEMDQMSEAEIKDQALATAKDAEQSTDRSIRMLENSMAIAAATSDNLQKQSAQLDSTGKALGTMDEHLDTSDRLVKGMSSLKGGFKNWRQDKKAAKAGAAGAAGAGGAAAAAAAAAPVPAVAKKPMSAAEKMQSEMEAKRAARMAKFGGASGGAGKAAPKKPAYFGENDEVDQTMSRVDQNMDKMGDMLDALDNVAQDMTTEMKQQGSKIKNIDEQVDTNRNKMSIVGDKMKKLF